MTKTRADDDATHYEQVQTLYDDLTAEIPKEEQLDSALEQVKEVLRHPQQDEATVAAVKLAALLDVDEFSGLALWVAEKATNDITTVLDVRYGQSPDRNTVDNRTLVQMYHVRAADRIFQMGRVEVVGGDDVGFVTYPEAAAREDMMRIRDDFDDPTYPDKTKQVEVKENVLGLDIPDYDDKDEDDESSFVASFSPSDNESDEETDVDLREYDAVHSIDLGAEDKQIYETKVSVTGVIDVWAEYLPVIIDDMHAALENRQGVKNEKIELTPSDGLTGFPRTACDACRESAETPTSKYVSITVYGLSGDTVTDRAVVCNECMRALIEAFDAYIDENCSELLAEAL